MNEINSTLVPTATQIFQTSPLPKHIPEDVEKEVLYAFIPFIVMANGFIILLFITNHKLRSIQANKYIIAHASNDLLVGTIFIPCVITQDEIIRGAIIMYSLQVSLLTLAVSTFDRYVAICKPLRYKNIQTDKMVYRSIALCWIVPICIVTLPKIWLHGHSEDFLSLSHRVYVAVTVATIFLILFGIIIAYVKILKSGVHHLKNQTSGRTHVNWYGRLAKELKFARLFFSLSVTFVVFWLPTGYMTFVDNVFLKSYLLPPDWVSQLNFYWIFMSSLLNPICYAIFHKSIRKSIKSFCIERRNPSAIVHPVTPVKSSAQRTSMDSNSISYGMIKVQPILSVPSS